MTLEAAHAVSAPGIAEQARRQRAELTKHVQELSGCLCILPVDIVELRSTLEPAASEGAEGEGVDESQSHFLSLPTL